MCVRVGLFVSVCVCVCVYVCECAYVCVSERKGDMYVCGCE